MTDTNDDSEREADLEARVEQLEATVEKMLPGRRTVLKGAAMAGALGLGAGGATAEASTDDEDADLGSPDNRVDLFADGVDAISVQTDVVRNADVVEEEDVPSFDLPLLLRGGDFGDVLGLQESDNPDGDIHQQFFDRHGRHVCRFGFHTHYDGDGNDTGDGHLKAYTADDLQSNDPDLVSRLQIGAGSDDVITTLGNHRRLRLESQAGDVYHRLHANGTNRCHLTFYDGNGELGRLRWSGDSIKLTSQLDSSQWDHIETFASGEVRFDGANLDLRTQGTELLTLFAGDSLYFDSAIDDLNFQGNDQDDVGGVTQQQRGAPTTSELDDGERMTYVSDGSDSHSAGDLVSARNNSGTIVSQVIAAAADDA